MNKHCVTFKNVKKFDIILIRTILTPTGYLLVLVQYNIEMNKIALKSFKAIKF